MSDIIHRHPLTHGQQKYKVECHYTHGWDDAGWTEDKGDGNGDQPITYASMDEAEADIDDVIAEANEAGLDHKRSDYRAVSI